MRRSAFKDNVWLDVAFDIAKMGTCPRREVGAVLLDVGGRVVSTGYNGPATYEPHCTDTPCPGAALPSGTGLSACEAIHAEINALTSATRPGWTLYCTDSPCSDCLKVMLNTSIRRVVFRREYPHPTSKARWLRSSHERTWEHIPEWPLLSPKSSVSKTP
jgi:dCMP deaminase